MIAGLCYSPTMDLIVTQPGKIKLLVIAFMSGAAVMIVEVAATRLLAPYFGASLFIWTSAISVILAALAIGYFIGGRLADRENIRRILTSVFMAASITTVLITYIVYFLGQQLPSFYSGDLPSITAFGVTLLAALVSLMPAGIFYGMVSPLIIEILGRYGHHPGNVAGQVFSVSTAGSIVGTIITPLVLFPSAGTHLTFVIVAAVMMTLAVLVAGKKRIWIFLLAIAILASGLIYHPDPFKGSNIVRAKESPYQSIRVEDQGERLAMIFNEGHGVQSVYYKNSPWTGSYWDWAAILPYLREKTDQQALIIGVAGGTIARIWNQTPVASRVGEIDGVEVDPFVIELAREYFALDELDFNIIIKDGRQHLMTSDKKYDLVYVDAYANEFVIPFQLTTVEFYQLIEQRSSKDAILALNLALGVRDSELIAGMLNTLALIYQDVYVLQALDAYNMLVIASQNPVDLSSLSEIYQKSEIPYSPLLQVDQVGFDHEKMIFTDDRAPLELLSDLLLFSYL